MKKISIRYALPEDLAWLTKHDIHLSSQWIARCISHQEIIVALKENHPIGFLRFSYFWGKIPYMDMINVLPEFQRKGIGTAMLDFWEQEIKQQKYRLIMTSSMQNEPETQAWHLRNGFMQSGQLTFGSV